MPPAEESSNGQQPSAFKRWMKRAWWLHSGFALSFGVGVMIYAKKGLEYADKILIVLSLSWALMFIALRFIVGPTNRRPDEKLHRKGIRLATNYVIKNLYQQMFFFLVPLYANSATWSFHSFNWWLPPVLLVCAVLSTMDLVFDNFIMEKRWLASLMYGFALFGVLNLMLPLAFGMPHFVSLVIAASATAPAVALLNFSPRSVFGPEGLLWTCAASAALFCGAWFGRDFVPPAPMSMTAGAVGHGKPSSYECLPARKASIPADQLDGLRCGSVVQEPGGVKDKIVHVWRHHGDVVFRAEVDVEPARGGIERLDPCGGETVDRSYIPAARIPEDPVGDWDCRVETEDGQLVGLMRFEIVPAETKPDVKSAAPQTTPGSTSP
jgi:hypothetical protein